MNLNSQLRDQFWHLLCHRTELPESGNFLKLNWLGQEVVLFNDCGEIIAFDNLCPHRGTRFFTELHGSGAISCPYHGWGYREGRLTIPRIENYDPLEICNARLNTLKIEWCADFLFISIAPLYSLEEQLGSEFSHLASISFDINGRSDFDTYTYECDWRVAIENALEPMHVSYIHSNSLGKLNFSSSRNEYTCWNSVVYSSIGNFEMEKKLLRIKNLFRVEEQFEGYMSIYMFPFTMLSSTFGYSYSLQNFFPTIEKNKTNFFSRLLTGTAKNLSAAEALQHFFKSSAEMNRQIFEEDHAICKRIDPNFHESKKLGFLAHEEEKIAHFRKCLAKFNLT